jgi:hypothetical protein
MQKCVGEGVADRNSSVVPSSTTDIFDLPLAAGRGRLPVLGAGASAGAPRKHDAALLTQQHTWNRDLTFRSLDFEIVESMADGAALAPVVLPLGKGGRRLRGRALRRAARAGRWSGHRQGSQAGRVQ